MAGVLERLGERIEERAGESAGLAELDNGPFMG